MFYNFQITKNIEKMFHNFKIAIAINVNIEREIIASVTKNSLNIN